MLNDELSLLAIYGLLVGATVLMQATGAMRQLGMGYLLSSRDEQRTVGGMTGRFQRALDNSVTALILVAVPILILALRDSFSDASLVAAQIFLMARIVYLPAYVFRITGLRTLAWAIGFAATAILYFLAL